MSIIIPKCKRKLWNRCIPNGTYGGVGGRLLKRGHRFVRYADGLLIFCKGKRAAESTLENITPFIRNKLLAKVNREKTQVGYIPEVKFLGYGFYVYKGEGRLRVHPKGGKIREVTGRSNGMGIEAMRTRLNQVIPGWANYFKLADMKTLMQTPDEWLRCRIRMITWEL